MVKIEDENIGPKGILWESLRGNNFFDLKYFENSQCSIGCYLSKRNEKDWTSFLSVLALTLLELQVYFLKQVYGGKPRPASEFVQLT